MRVRLDYGRTGLEVSLAGVRQARVLTAPEDPPLTDPVSSIQNALIAPIGSKSLAELAAGRRSACIAICDITRPVPNQVLLPPILRTLHDAGISRDNILILIATGLHRASTETEIVEMVGPEIASTYRIEDHDGKDEAGHRFLGMSAGGVPAWIDRRYLDADLKITTGLIEPHLMAGYSGGRKVICPGLAGANTIRAWHSPRFLEDPRAVCGVVDSNPVHVENTRIAKMAGCDFIVNVTIDGDRRITSVVAGDMELAWQQGVEECCRRLRVTIPEPADVVVTSSAGYPLDATFYQAVKGMTGVLPIVRQGGTIILAASMSEGVGSPEFTHLLETTDSLDEFMERISDVAYFVIDQWQLEELAKVRRHCRVKVVTEGLPATTLERYFVEPADSVEEALIESLSDYGSDARVAVVPRGPYLLPQVESRLQA